MPRKKIKIDTYIGSWGYGKQLLKMDLEGSEKDGTVIEISSLGGSVEHAIDMHNQIAQHGNVEVVFTGPSASAATFLAMGAKTVSMVDNAFFLAHKVWSTVDILGGYNEEDLDKLIQDLEKLKSENQKFDLVIARIYSKKSGKNINEVLNVMSRDTWLTADEALEFGFVDKVIPADEKYNTIAPLRMVAMVNQADLPPLPSNPLPSYPLRQRGNIHDDEKNMFERFLGWMQERINHKEVKPINEKINMDQFTNVNAILQVDALEGDENGCYLNQEQLGAIDSRVAELSQAEFNYGAAIEARDAARGELETANARVAELNAQVETNATDRDILQAQVAAFAAAFDAIDPTVAAAATPAEKANALRAIIAAKPAAPVPGTLDTADPKPTSGDVDWKTINSLPHNQLVDDNL